MATDSASSVTQRLPTLRPLIPLYVQAEHQVYAQVLRHALRDSRLRNIALTGAYGTGKSSVLRRVAEDRDFRVLEIALSSVNAQQSTWGAGSQNDEADSVPNQIQKEIVKQILYRDTPSRTRGSRFRRIQRFRWIRHTAAAAMVSAASVALLYWLGWGPLLREGLADDDPTRPWWGYGAIFLSLSAVVLWGLWLTHDRVFLEKATAGPATLSLSSSASSFFDQYLDEIVYFFEVSRTDVVIFEDLDRFNDVRIFESLRALNTLLNNSEQIRSRRRWSRRNGGHVPLHRPVPDVKFVYALKDSVFQNLETHERTAEGLQPQGDAASSEADGWNSDRVGPFDAARDELVRANRTKFFDLVIPIVPFITHRNARDLMRQTMDGSGVSADLISLAARYVADMRLIINMRNEFDIFADRLLEPANRVPELTADKLFAMILYKSVHMGDFEKIRLGQSQLDHLHTAWRQLVEAATDDAVGRLRDAERRLNGLDSTADRSAVLGERLRRILDVPQRLIGRCSVDAGRRFEFSDLGHVDLWRHLTSAGAIGVRAGGYGPHNVTRADLELILGEALDPEAWTQYDRSHLKTEVTTARQDLGFLGHHTWQEIAHRPEFATRLDLEGSPKTFRQIAEYLLRSPLAVDLIAAGYVDDYYALYISKFYGTYVSREAWSFIVRTVDRGEHDMLAQLTKSDIKAIIDDRGESALTDRRSYNNSILAYLLTDRTDLAEQVIEQIASWDSVEREFATRFIAQCDVGDEEQYRGGDPAPRPTRMLGIQFIRLLAPRLGGVINFIAYADVELSIEPKFRVELLDAALSHLDPTREYPADEHIRQLILDSYPHFASLTDTGTALHKATTIQAIATLGLRVPSVAGFNHFACSEAVRLAAYMITIENIAVLTRQDSVALDEIKSHEMRVFQTILERLPEYLAAVDVDPDARRTVTSPDAFLAVLADLGTAQTDATTLRRIIGLAHPDCTVEDVTTVPVGLWPPLAWNRRMSVTTRNLLAYLDEHATVDEDLGRLLSNADVVQVDEAIEDADRRRLALAILNARAHVISPQRRASLAASVQVGTYLAPSELQPESGPLISLLLAERLVEDDSPLFESSLIPDWSTRELAIGRSNRFPEFCSSAVVPANELREFFNSPTVPIEAKRTLLEDLSSFSHAEVETLQAAATFAIGDNTPLSVQQLDMLREGGLPDNLLVPLAVQGDLDIADLRDFLRRLHDPYMALADVGWGRLSVPNDAMNRRLLERLQGVTVSTWDDDSDKIKVNRRRTEG